MCAASAPYWGTVSWLFYVELISRTDRQDVLIGTQLEPLIRQQFAQMESALLCLICAGAGVLVARRWTEGRITLSQS